MKPRRVSWKWLLTGFLVLAVTGLVLGLSRQFGAPPELRDKVAASLADWTGGTVTLTEPLRVRYFPPSVEGGLVLSDATMLPAVRTVTAPHFKASLGFLAFLSGRLEIEALQLGRPTISLKDLSAEQSGAVYFPQLLTSLTGFVPIETVRIRNGRLVSGTGERLVRKLDVRANAHGNNGALNVLGSFLFKGETVTFALDAGHARQDEAQHTAPISLKITSRPLTARLSGSLRAADTTELTGEMTAELPDARRLLSWMGVGIPEGESLKDVTATGKIHWSGPTLTFDDGSFAFDGNEAVGLFAVTSKVRPRIDGTLAFETLVLDPYIGPEPWEENLFDVALLKYLDADLRISARELTAGELTLGQSGFTVHASKGKISSEVGELDVCGGQATGRVELDLSKTRPALSLTGKIAEIEIEPCLRPLQFGLPLKGKSVFDFDVSTRGTSHGELIRGLAGKTSLAVRDGVVPIDFPGLMTQASDDELGWSQDTGTAFDVLEADCRLSAGQLWCQSFRMETSNGIVSGSGRLDVERQTLDWSFLIADPVAPLDASQLVMEAPPRVALDGPLAAPKIRRVDRAEDGSPETKTDGTPDPSR